MNCEIKKEDVIIDVVLRNGGRNNKNINKTYCVRDGKRNDNN